jgi:hypothetical protein
MRAPRTLPGQIAFTRIRYGPSSMASVFMKPMSAHLHAVYGVLSGYPKKAALEETSRIEPPPAVFRSGTARRAQ